MSQSNVALKTIKSTRHKGGQVVVEETEEKSSQKTTRGEGKGKRALDRLLSDKHTLRFGVDSFRRGEKSSGIENFQDKEEISRKKPATDLRKERDDLLCLSNKRPYVRGEGKDTRMSGRSEKGETLKKRTTSGRGGGSFSIMGDHLFFNYEKGGG